MNRIFSVALTLVLLFGASAVRAQMKVSYGDAPVATRPVAALRMDQVDKLPEFKGDLVAFMVKNLEYSDSAREAHMEGSTTVEFTVTITGLVQELRVTQSSGFPLLDAEALRLMGLMQKTPHWTPGMLNGRAVPVRYSLPITFG